MFELSAIAVAYFLGSIPSGFLLSRRRGIDLRAAGSGNVGASNVLRTTGAVAALVTMGLDVAKGAAAVLIAQSLSSEAAIAPAAGLAAIAGHVYPVWLRFRGGKGVATAAGAFGVLAPVPAAVAVLVFVAVVWRTRYVSVGSTAAAAALVLMLGLGGAPAPVLAAGAAAAVLIAHRHRANFARLRGGTEHRVGEIGAVELMS